MGKGFIFIDVRKTMRRLTRKLLILLIVLILMAEIQGIPVGTTAYCDAAHTNEPQEAQNVDNVNSNNADPTLFGPCENYDDQLYESSDSTEDNLSDAELGQKLLTFLLKTGEIKEKSTNPLIQNEALARRHEQIKNDRYDELIAAFNVILEEIILQGNLKSSSVQENFPNHMNNDRESDVIEQSDDICKTDSCVKNEPSSTDPMNRCLTRFERELLQKIKTLTNLLNSAMKKRNNNKELNDNLHESYKFA